MTNPFDKLLEKKGLEYEDLTKDERDFYNNAEQSIKSISLNDLAENITDVLYSLLLDHCNTPDTPEHQDTNNKIKARLKNYLVMLTFLNAPKKAIRELERSIEKNSSNL